jgi:hypothetical protein
MNRAERRKKERENRRNSKKNYQYVGIKEIPVQAIQHDPNLKEPDKEIIELCQHEYEWRETNAIKHEVSRGLIMTGISYLDSLCALRFDITPADDKVLVRNTMYHICNAVNYFLGLCGDDQDTTIVGLITEAKARKCNNVDMPVPEGAEIYPMHPLPNEDAVDDLYAGFVVSHAYDLADYLTNAKPSDIIRDEEYVFEVLNMIVKKTRELLPEAEVDSESFIVEL